MRCVAGICDLYPIKIFCEIRKSTGKRRMNKKGVPMTRHSKKLRMWIWLLALPLLQLGAGVAFAQNAVVSQSASGQAVQFDYSTVTPTEACIHCHKDNGEQALKTRHSGTFATGPNAPETVALCDACHGSGKAHADAEIKAEQNDVKDPEAKNLIFRFNESAEKNSARCLTCHASDKTHISSSNSFHRQNDVGCIAC